MNTSSDEIKFLSSTSSTILELDWNQILTKITSGRVDEETLTARIFNRDR
jgi:hypothetical protein